MEHAYREEYKGKMLIVWATYSNAIGIWFSATVEGEPWEVYCGDKAQEQLTLLKRDVDQAINA